LRAAREGALKKGRQDPSRVEETDMLSTTFTKLRLGAALLATACVALVPMTADASVVFSDGVVVETVWGCQAGSARTVTTVTGQYGPVYHRFYAGQNGSGGWTDWDWTWANSENFKVWNFNGTGWFYIWYEYGRYTNGGQWESGGEWISAQSLFWDGSAPTYLGWCYIS
jgi:hypothetical protein